jgi:hypothetical protein
MGVGMQVRWGEVGGRGCPFIDDVTVQVGGEHQWVSLVKWVWFLLRPKYMCYRSIHACAGDYENSLFSLVGIVYGLLVGNSFL